MFSEFLFQINNSIFEWPQIQKGISSCTCHGREQTQLLRNTNHLMHPVTGHCPETAPANPVNFLLTGKAWWNSENTAGLALTSNPAGSRPEGFIVFLWGLLLEDRKNPHLMPHPHCHIGGSLNKWFVEILCVRGAGRRVLIHPGLFGPPSLLI